MHFHRFFLRQVQVAVGRAQLKRLVSGPYRFSSRRPYMY